MKGYIRFTGDYKKLKSMGFSFQKLFAGNYMQWSRDGMRIWKKGSEVTHDTVDLYKFVKFMETNPVVRESKDFIRFYKFYSNSDANEYDFYPMTEENDDKYREFLGKFSSKDYDKNNPPFYLGDSISIKKSLIEQLTEMKDMGWYVLSYYPPEA